MNWRATTEMLIVLTVVAVCLYDVAARVFGGNSATVSAVVAEASHRWPVVPLGVGICIGHIFWPWR